MTTTEGQRVEYAPQDSKGNQTTGVLSVSLSDDEIVEWTWFGGHVCGYTIRKTGSYKKRERCYV